MRIAILSDIHSNPWALERVLDCISDVEMIYVLGDVVGIGPRPAEVVDILRKEDRVRMVMGNHDHNTLHGTEFGPTDIVPRRPHHDWMRSRLHEDQIRFLDNPFMISILDGLEITFMHRHPDDCGSRVPYFDRPYPEVLDDFYSDVPGDLLFFGHTHVPLDVQAMNGRRYINPGSVGAENKGKASFVTMDLEKGPGTIIRMEAEYDLQCVVEELIDMEVPYYSFIVDHFFKA